MLRVIVIAAVGFALLGGMTGCLPAHEYAYARKTTKEELCIHPRDSAGLLMHKFAHLPDQDIATLDERIHAARGLLANGATSLIGLAISGAKTIITNEKGKYTANTKFAKTELYFYDQPSLDGPFDPAGMQFTGFDLVRTIKNDVGELDTAFLATFIVDTSKSQEILNDHVFRLKLTAFREKYIKPKVAVVGQRKMSVEFDISFMTTYTTDRGTIYDSLVLGKFHCMLKDISIDHGDPEFGTCRREGKDKEMEVTGKSFIVPRSSGYFKTGNKIVPGYNQGAFSIMVAVKECTKPNFATTYIIQNGSSWLDDASKAADSKVTQMTTPVTKKSK
jgi:hypothetical protein